MLYTLTVNNTLSFGISNFWTLKIPFKDLTDKCLFSPLLLREKHTSYKYNIYLKIHL